MDQAKLGDRVACRCNGGPHHIVTGASTALVDGVPAARVGDRSSCGSTITTGLGWYLIEGAAAAIQGSATSCGGVLEASATARTGSPSRVGQSAAGGLAAAAVAGASAAMSNSLLSANRDAASQPAESSSQAGDGEDDRHDDHVAEPGFVVVRKLTPRAELKRELLPAATADIDAMFERLNTHLSDVVLPGSLVVLSDPQNLQCQADEGRLMGEARKVRDTVQQLEPAQAQAMVDNWGALMDLSNDIDAASTNLGVASSGLSQLTSATAEVLDDMASAYDVGAAYVRDRSPALWNRFETQARQWINRPFELPDAARDLKARIGVASGQAVHSVKQALGGFPEFRLPTVSEGIRRAGSIAKTLDAANYVAIALDYTATDLRVENACREAALSDECRRVKFVEYGGLGGRTFGGAVGARAGGSCLAIGIHPGGSLLCAVAVSGAGAYGGMQAGDYVGKMVGETIYEIISGGDTARKDVSGE